MMNSSLVGPRSAGGCRDGRSAGRHACLLSLAVLAAAVFPLPGYAQQTAGTESRALQRFEIPTQPLRAALNAFGRQADLQVTVDAALTADFQAPAVAGAFTPAEALSRLLAGSGISWQFTGDRTVLLSRAADGSGAVTLEPVTVLGAAAGGNGLIDNLPPPFAGGQVATGGQLGLLGNRDIMDTPFNITSYTSGLLRNQQAATLADVLANDPSVRVDIRGRGTNNGGGDQFLIRGFRFPNSDTTFNGLYGVLPAGTVSMETVERVEVLKGPNALLNGMAPSGGVGGAVNIVPKRAGDDPINRLTATYGSRSQLGGHMDVGRRYGDRKQFGIRFNGVYKNGDTAVEEQTNELRVAALGLDFRGERLRLSADLGYQDDRTDVPSSWGGGLRLGGAVTDIPSAPRADARTAQLWEYVEYEDRYGVVRGEYDLLPDVTAYLAFGARNYDQVNLRTSSTLIDNSGTLISSPSYYPQYADTRSGEAGLRGTLQTGGIRHDWSLGASLMNQEVGYAFDAFGAGFSDLYTIATLAEPVTTGFSETAKSSESRLRSAALADTLVLADDRVWLTLGLRHQRVAQDSFNTTTGAVAASYDESAVTPALGLVVKPWQDVSLYANYIEGLSQGSIAPAGTSNAGEVFPPIKTRQAEVGAKLDLQTFGSSLSLFQIDQPNPITTPGATAGTTVYSIDGEQRNRGIELTGFGEPLPGLRLLGGVTWLDARQVKTQGGMNDGNTAVGVPRWMANLGVEWDTAFADGLTLSARTLVTGAAYANAGNSLQIPAWTRLDLGARYKLDAYPVELRANLLNATDLDYWESATAPQGLRLGAPRTVLLSVAVDF